MAEGSMPPRERINITYKSETGDAQAEKELPLRLVMLGDYTQREETTPVENRPLLRVNKDNFSEVMERQNLSLDLLVPDRLRQGEGQAAGEMTLHLAFQSLKDFEPEQVAEQVPELKALLDLRKALHALRGPMGNSREFRAQLQSLLSNETSRARLLQELGIDKSGAA